MSDLCKGKLTQAGSDFVLNHQYFICHECHARLTVTGDFLSEHGIPKEHMKPQPTKRGFDFVGGIYRMDLGVTPTIDTLRRVFYDLYAQQRLEPQYLFVSMNDYKTLRYEILSQVFARHTLAVNSFDVVSTLLGQCCTPMDKPTHLVALPGLEDGSVILGFFGERRW